MKQEILQYLISHKENADPQFTQFLRDEFSNNSRRLVRDTIQQMWRDGLIAGPGDALIAAFMPRENLEKRMIDFPDNIVGWSITTAGERQYFDDEFRSQVMELNRISIQANQSSIDTNRSVRELNSFQKRMMIVSAVLAFVSLLAIATPLITQNSAVKGTDIQALTRQMNAESMVLDSIKLYERGIDESLRRIIEDTSTIRRRQVNAIPNGVHVY